MVSRHQPEAGFALPLVLLVVVVVGALVALLFNNARFELRETAQARDYEAALHSAEAVLESAFAELLAGGTLPAVEWAGPGPGTDRIGERTEVLRQVAVLGPSAVTVDTPAGRATAVGPVPSSDPDDRGEYLYAAAPVDTGQGVGGYRILRTRLAAIGPEEVDEGSTSHAVTFSDYALHLNSDLTISGNVEWIRNGGVAANGNVKVRQTLGERLGWVRERPATNHLTIASASGSIECLDDWCPAFVQDPWVPAPPLAGAIQTAAPPVLNARDVHRRYAAEVGQKPGVGDWYDLCPPTADKPLPSVHEAPTSPGAPPCTGAKIQDITGSYPFQTYNGWEYQTVAADFFDANGNTVQRNVKAWTKGYGSGDLVNDGMYYAHESNVMTWALGSQHRRLTIIASADPDDLSSGYGARSGNVWWQGNSRYYHYEGIPGMDLAVFADRDIVAGGLAHARGAVYAREQFRSRANNFEVIGTAQAAGAPLGPPGPAPADRSSPGSPVHTSGPVEWGPSGGFKFQYEASSFEVDPGPDAAPTTPPELSDGIWVRTWDEL